MAVPTIVAGTKLPSSFSGATYINIPRREPTEEEVRANQERASNPLSFDNANTFNEVATLGHDFTLSIGMESFLLGVFIPALGKNGSIFGINGYPKEWMDTYNDRGYIDIDPVVSKSMEEVVPFEWWEIDFSKAHPRAAELFMLAAKFGICSGFSFRIWGRSGSQAILNVSTSKAGFQLKERREDVFAKSMLFAARALAAVVRIVERDNVNKLSERQLEALQLASIGHLNKSIAVHMKVKEKTVEYFFREAQRNLGVKTRTQAIAKATQMGLIANLHQAHLPMAVQIVQAPAAGPEAATKKG